MLLLLFAVLISTALCRMFGYGQHTMLQLNSNDIVCRRACRVMQPQTNRSEMSPRQGAAAGMVRLAQVTGVMSIVSKILVVYHCAADGCTPSYCCSVRGSCCVITIYLMYSQ